MIDRYGNPVRVAWPLHHIVWIDAAMTLSRDQRSAAFQDIADMAGRPLHAVRNKAYDMQAARHQASAPRRILVPARSEPRQSASLPPSQIAPTSEAQKMAGRA